MLLVRLAKIVLVFYYNILYLLYHYDGDSQEKRKQALIGESALFPPIIIYLTLLVKLGKSSDDNSDSHFKSANPEDVDDHIFRISRNSI